MVGAIVLAGCGARPTAVAACDWTGAHAVLLADDIRHAEDIAIRYADSVGYREGWRQTREACDGALFAGLAASRNVSTAEIAAARAQLDSRGFDWLVNAPMAFLYGWLSLIATRRLQARFAEERIAFVTALAIMSVGLAVAIVAVGQLWASGVEVARIGNGHLSYRASRIPWSGHRIETFTLAIIATWALAVAQRLGMRTRHSAPGTNP